MKSIIKLSTLFSLFLLIISCKNNKENSLTAEPEVQSNIVTLSIEQQKNLAIHTDSIRMVSLPKKWSVTGQIITPTENEVAVSVPYGGYVKQASWMPGMPVKKGQLLTYIENEQFISLQEEYLTVVNKLKLSATEVTRQTALNKDKSSSDKILAQTIHDHELLKVSQKAIAQKLALIGIAADKLNSDNISKQIGIYAPISGVISTVNVKKGQYVNATDVMFELVNTGNQKMALKVFEKDLPYISIGQSVVAHLPNDESTTIKGKVQYIAPTINENRYAEIITSIDNAGHYNNGTYVNASIQSKALMTWMIPAEAVIEFEGQKFVFIANGKAQFIMTPCKTEEAAEGYLHLLDYAPFKGKEIVTKGAYGLLMKLKNREE